MQFWPVPEFQFPEFQFRLFFRPVPTPIFVPYLSRIFGNGVPAFVSGSTDVWTWTGDWELFGATEERFTVLARVSILRPVPEFPFSMQEF
jgi:hypothetical protein